MIRHHLAQWELDQSKFNPRAKRSQGNKSSYKSNTIEWRWTSHIQNPKTGITNYLMRRYLIYIKPYYTTFIQVAGYIVGQGSTFV